jgi:5-methylcytosine-specific restriction endonuclease McrA
MQAYRALYGTRRWRRLSLTVVAAAGGQCAVVGDRATAADHFPLSALELAERGELHRFFDVTNLRALCRRCNSRAGARLVNSRRRGRRMVDATRAAEEWAVRERAYWAEVERATARGFPQPRIY